MRINRSSNGLSLLEVLSKKSVITHHPLIPKNASFVLSTVGTRTDLSRYLFPRSQEVSGKKRQA